MDGITLLIGLIVWFFGIVGFIHLGKKAMKAFGGYVARDPEGFQKNLGVEPEPTTKN